MAPASGRSLALLFAALAALSPAACERIDQRARDTGRSARAGAAEACAPRPPDEIEACLRERCEGPCVPFKETPTFQRECVAACVARGECATNADCGGGARCIAVAPRVRRCEAPTLSDAGP